MSMTFFNQYPFLRGFNDNAPHHWQPNMTDWYDPIIMYGMCVAYGFKNILEIGQAEGYTSWYLANAAKHFGGTYLGIDIQDTWNRPHEPFGYSLKRYFEGEMVPARFICSDTMLMKEIPSYRDGGLDIIDLAFIDGRHETPYIMHEVYDLILPKIRKEGWGFICLDDIIDQGAQEAWSLIKKDKQFEHLTMHPNGGFGILRVKNGAD